MAMTLRPDIRRALTERVGQRVAGRGVPQAVVDDAVRRVVEQIESSQAGSQVASNPRPDGQSSFLAAVSARSIPDLASRVRRGLERDGIAVTDVGHGTAGQHTVVTLRLPAAARPALERLAEQHRFSLSLLSSDELDAADAGSVAPAGRA